MRPAICALLPLLTPLASAETYAWAPGAPGPSRIVGSTLANKAISYSANEIVNVWTGERLRLDPNRFKIFLRGGKTLDGKGMRLSRVNLTRPAGVTERGTATFPGGLKVEYAASLLEDRHYARLTLKLEATKDDVDVASVQLVGGAGPGLTVQGKVSGSPLASEEFFAGVEHPMSHAEVRDGLGRAWVERGQPLQGHTSVTYSAVIGVTPQGQLRRSFLSYLEAERPRPYKPFLHYNSWYDIGFFTEYNEAECLDRINTFGQELANKRGVKVSSFLFDDGWDNYESLWEFHKGFPKGFLPLRDAAAKFGAGPGVWLSPWGGYGTPRTRRLAYGKAHGMEVDSQGYALSGPNYYKRFHEVTMDFVTRQGINQFKFDGTGSPDKKTPGSKFDSDFDAAISLISDLRKARPDLFVNLTTGTWPSPFWVRYADSIWRGGSDHSFAGVGTSRQQWITYRDGDTLHGVVERGPLYPLNSLMLHGLIYAQHANKLNNDPGNDFRSEVRSYFGSGTQLQEMYITPSLLTSQNWDDLAEAARWSQDNAEVLRDTHWVGGDPNKLEVYGWASWSERKSILVLRNPSDAPQAFNVDIGRILELPARHPERYVARSPWKGESTNYEFVVGKSKVVDLKPFEVLVLDLEAGK